MNFLTWFMAIICLFLGIHSYHQANYARTKGRMLEQLLMAAWFALYAVWYIVDGFGGNEALKFAIMVAACCPMIARGVITKSSMVRMNSIICILVGLLNALTSYARIRA